jgi:hypothetical protein
MKKLIFGLLLSSCVLLTGCIDIVEEMTLNKNGSGIYTFTIDMSSILQLGSLKDLMNQAGADAEAQKKLGMDKMEKDTTIYFKDMPAELKAETGNPDFWKKAQMNMKMSEKDKKFLVQMKLNFDKIEDIEFFFKNMSKVMKEGAGSMGGLPTDGLAPTSVAFKLAKKSLTRLPTVKAENAPGAEDLEMMKMFLGTAKYKTIYNLPNRVKKTKIANAKIDGNTVTVENSMLDILEGKAKLDGEISF